MKTDLIRVVIAGSSAYTAACLEALINQPNMEVVGVMTPSAQPQGRDHQRQANPLAVAARKIQLPLVEVNQRIDDSIKQQLTTACPTPPDFLLVVDFGYLIPEWLLQWPTLAPLNLHPSALPRWRGSSPGQFVLLAGETKSAVSLIQLTQTWDAGPIFSQLQFDVGLNWNQHDYYSAAFSLAVTALPGWLQEIAHNSLQPQPQPADSPTPLARRLRKEDGFIPWSILKSAQQATSSQPPISQVAGLPELFQQIHQWQAQRIAQFGNITLAEMVNRGVKALAGWPHVWTELTAAQGKRRIIIQATHLDSKSGALIIDQAQVAGQQPTSWNSLKTIWQTAT